jgi:hypothetical protein
MADVSVDSVLSSIAGTWDAVKWYDPLDAADPWKTSRVGGQFNDLTAIDNTIGVWVHVTANCTLTVEGAIPATTLIPLHAGWNLVGYPSQTPRTVADALWGTSADHADAFDPVSPAYISEAGPEYVMAPGNGYWVHVVADCVWTVDW